VFFVLQPSSPPISTTGYGNVLDIGGEVSLTLESGGKARALFPPDSVEGTVVVRINPKDKEEVIENNPLPKDNHIVGDLLADFKAFSGIKELESFKKEVTITFYYNDEQIGEDNLDEESLDIYWWDENNKNWQSLGGEVDTTLNEVSGSISHFALFALVGQEITGEGVPAGEEATAEELKAKIIEIQKKIIDTLVQLIQLIQNRINEILGQ